MIVNISNYGKIEDKNFVEYLVSDLSLKQKKFLKENLNEEIVCDENIFKLTMYFDDEMYPFGSDAAKIRIDDFIAREQIEMFAFLSSFLEDME
jgi:hypothetical protein